MVLSIKRFEPLSTSCRCQGTFSYASGPALTFKRQSSACRIIRYHGSLMVTVATYRLGTIQKTTICRKIESNKSNSPRNCCTKVHIRIRQARRELQSHGWNIVTLDRLKRKKGHLVPQVSSIPSKPCYLRR